MYWNAYTIPVYISALILLIIFILLLRLRNTKGALLFAAVVACFFIYSIGYGLVISANSLEIALKFFTIERLGASLIPSFYLIFAASFIEKYNLLSKRFIPLYFIIPVFSIIVLFTNQFHYLFYSNPRFEEGVFFESLSYTPGVWYYIQQFYIIIGSLVVNVILITLFIAGTNIYRKQIGTIVIGSLAMILLHTLFHPNMIGLLNLKINPTPYFSSISGIIIYIGLRRYNLFRFVPIVRDVLFEKMADGVIVIDKNKVIIDFNHTAAIYQNLNQLSIGKPAADNLDFWDTLRVGEASEGERCDYEYKTEVYGVAAFFHIDVSPYFDKNNSFQGQIIVIRDITHQKEAEKTLESQSRLINTMLDNLPIGIFMVEAKTGKPLIVNNKAKELLGRGILPDATAENLSEVYEAFKIGTRQKYPTDEMPIVKGMKGISSRINDMEVERPDGSRIQLEIFGCPVYDSNSRIVASLVGFFDISERIEYEKRIQNQNEELKELNATKDKFFSIIAHDLKTPFNAILGFSEILIKQYDEFGEDEIKEYSGVINKSAQQAFKLLENLLEWSRIKRGLVEFQPKQENLLLLINESIEPLLDSAYSKEIQIHRSEGNGIDVFVDRRMVMSIFRNLISNAIKFSSRGSKIEVFSSTHNDFVEVVVKDQGIGMDKELVNNLFRIDAKINRTGTEGEPSSGLGLLLCKEFVEKHNGKIWVESEADAGSSFFFTLPVCRF